MSSTIDGTAPLFNILAVLERHEQLHHALAAAREEGDENRYDAVGNDIDVQVSRTIRELGAERALQLIHFALEMAKDGFGWHTESQLDESQRDRLRDQVHHLLHEFIQHESAVTV